MCLPTKEVRNIVFLGFLPLSMKDRIEYKIHFNCDTSTNKYAYEARCARLNRKSRF